MKKLIVLASAIILSSPIFAQDGTTTAMAPQKKAADEIKFKELNWDFGKIRQSTPVSHEFTFTNISDGPVIIESTLASCGCTTPVKPMGAIPRGKSDKIRVEYNASVGGAFKKTVTVKVAGVQEPVVLTITGTVLSHEDFDKEKSGR
jgi:hypothetical protein